MSFLKKLTKEFEGLKTSFSSNHDKKKDKDGQHDLNHQHQSYGQQSHDQHAYGGSQGPSYSAPSHSLAPGPPGMAPLPPGWVAQFDQPSQRWYYVEQATGRTQWDPPSSSAHYPPPPGQYGAHPPPGAPGYPGQRGYGPESGAYYGAHGSAMPPHGGHGHSGKDGKGGMMLGAAGGLAAGAVGGAVLANALDSDDGHHHAAAGSGLGYGAPQSGYPNDSSYGDPSMPPPGLPTHTADGDSVSGSDRESVQEAREEYEEAAAAAADSDASSSDHEELEEAREEYEEEYEETYDD